MLGIAKTWFKALSTTAKIGVVSAAIISGGVVNAAVNPPQSPSTSNTPASQVTACTSTTTTSIEKQTLPFDKSSVNDPNTPQGQSYVKTPGVDGSKTQTYDVTTYSPAGCKQDTKTLVNENVTTQPVTEVTAVGTYVAPSSPTCTNGSYTNVDGVQVCSPSSNPTGATAQCVDGTYSYSLNHSGTCSHHGGVAQWL